MGMDIGKSRQGVGGRLHLQNQVTRKGEELEDDCSETPSDFFVDDLDQLLFMMDDIEEQRAESGDAKTMKIGNLGKVFNVDHEKAVVDTLPSPMGCRVESRIDHVTKVKAESAEPTKKNEMSAASQPFLVGNGQLSSMESTAAVTTLKQSDHNYSLANSVKSVNNNNLLKTVHTKENPNACELCEKEYTKPCFLKRHMLTHTRETSYDCVYCDFSSLYKSCLTRHIVVHSGEKPHICDQCGKSFNLTHNLENHRRIHTGEKPYICNQCGKSFNLSNNLKKHSLVHMEEKAHACADCGKSFVCGEYLKKHRRAHTGEKPFTCTECGKSFSLSCGLSSHRLIHSDRKPHVCSECGDSFRWGNGLSRHKLTHPELE